MTHACIIHDSFMFNERLRAAGFIRRNSHVPNLIMVNDLMHIYIR